MGIDSRTIITGIIAGLTGTIIMDIVMVGFFIIIGTPLDTFFLFIGDAAGEFLRMLGISSPENVLLGGIIHYLLGPLLGILFLAGLLRFRGLRINSGLRTISYSIICVEITSTILLIPAVILLDMASAEILLLIGMAVFLHAIWGITFGMVAYGRR